MNPKKLAKLNMIVQAGEEIATILNAQGYTANNVRILGMIALAVSMMRKQGLDYDKIRSIVTSLINDLEIYEQIREIQSGEIKTGEKVI